MLHNLKQYLSINLLAFAAYPAIFTFIRIFKDLLLGDICAWFIYYLVVGYYIFIIFLVIIIFIIEQIKNKKILQNKNILQNKIYNVCFNIGLSFGILLISFFISTIIYSFIVD